jgi:hypothetical protein
MKVTVEYDIPDGDNVVLSEREEQRWAIALQNLDVGTAVARLELIDKALSP